MAGEKSTNQAASEVEPVELPELEASPRGKPLVLRSMDVIRDVQINISAVLGTASISVERLFGLKQGDVLDLEQAADAPIEIFVEGHLVAQGQIVVTGERFGVLITDISAP